MLASRLASHALASCSWSACSTISGWQGLCLDQRRSAAAAASDSSADASAAPAAQPSLTPAQKQQLPRLLALLQKPGSAAQRLGSLASACVSSRDLAVAMTSLHLRQHGFTQPLLVTDEEYAARVPAASLSPAPRGSYLPLKDTTLDDDSVTVAGRPAPAEQPLDQRYMDKATAWAQTLPNHIEMSYPLLTGIKLFPPQEATYPTYVDFDAATRLLRHRQSRRKLRLARRLARKQDKYQLKTWDHYVGEA